VLPTGSGSPQLGLELNGDTLAVAGKPTQASGTLLGIFHGQRSAAQTMNPLTERIDVRLDTSLELLLEHAPASDAARVLATVVATSGSTYRKSGARMLIMSDGSYLGLLSGGCLEADLQMHAQEVILSGVPRAVEYDMRGPNELLFGIGTGCEGAMRILLEPASATSPAALALAEAAGIACRGLPTSLVVVHEAADQPLGTYAPAAQLPAALLDARRQVVADARSAAVSFESAGASAHALVEYLAPPPHLLVCGAGPDAVPVLATARALGWLVTVVDHRPAYLNRRRFPGARLLHTENCACRDVVDVGRCHAAVVMSHHLASDTAYLLELAAANVPAYVGLLGPNARRERLMQDLGPAAASLQGRLHSPVGLNLGAVTPEAIALAIVSEIHAWLAAGEDRSIPQAQRADWRASASNRSASSG
jgi:xanthine dehydrogenase accessory factor